MRPGRSSVVLIVASALLCAGCPCDPGFPEVFRDDFENQCGDMPCHWVTDTGEARRVETFHDSEHGLRLSDNARVRRTVFDASLDPDQTFVAGLMQCDPGAGLRFTIVYDAEGDPAHLTGELPPGFCDQTRVMNLYAADMGVHPLSIRVQVLSIVIELTGTGQCVIDKLAIQNGPYNHCEG